MAMVAVGERAGWGIGDTRLIFVEGVMGSGKSTTANFVARQLRRNGIPARYIFEGGERHVVRLMPDLPHPFKPWLDLTPDEFRARSLAKWRAFVAEAGQAEVVSVFDGQLFHGNMTDLLLMDASRDELRAYVGDVIAVVRDLNPVLIYLDQTDLEQALRRVFAERALRWPDFEEYQVGWKVPSPYGERRGLVGLDGLISIYRDYREMTDELFSLLDIARLGMENAGGAWPEYRRSILGFLGLPLVEDTDFSWLPAGAAGGG
jgi:hypothetical protein